MGFNNENNGFGDENNSFHDENNGFENENIANRDRNPPLSCSQAILYPLSDIISPMPIIAPSSSHSITPIRKWQDLMDPDQERAMMRLDQYILDSVDSHLRHPEGLLRLAFPVAYSLRHEIDQPASQSWHRLHQLLVDMQDRIGPRSLDGHHCLWRQSAILQLVLDDWNIGGLTIFEIQLSVEEDLRTLEMYCRRAERQHQH